MSDLFYVAIAVVAIVYLVKSFMDFAEREDKRLGATQDKYKWLVHGLDRGWMQPYCATHDGYLTSEEEALYEEYDDPCIPIYRLTED